MGLSHITWSVLKVSMFGFRVLWYENKKPLQNLQSDPILSSDHIFQRLYVFRPTDQVFSCDLYAIRKYVSEKMFCKLAAWGFPTQFAGF